MNWVAQTEIDDGKRGGLTTDEKAVLRRLRAENRGLRMEKDLLQIAAAFFAAKNAHSRSHLGTEDPCEHGMARSQPTSGAVVQQYRGSIPPFAGVQFPFAPPRHIR